MSIYYWNGVDEVPLDVEEVIVDDGVTEIYDFAFSSRTEMTSISLPESLEIIGKYVFNDCDSLTTITIPKNVSQIGEGSLCFCNNLENISVESGNSYFSSSHGILYDYDKTKLIQYPVGKDTTEVSILSSVVTILEYAFNDCEKLKKLTLGENVRSIGNYAFTNCVSLESITFDLSLQAIGACAFYNCPKLKAVTLLKPLLSIGYRAFGYHDLGQLYPDFWIRGYKDTDAERYAKENDITFVSIFEPIYPTGIAWVEDFTCDKLPGTLSYDLPSSADSVLEVKATVDKEEIILESGVDYNVSTVSNKIRVTFVENELVLALTTATVTYFLDRSTTTINVGEIKNCRAYVLPAEATYRNIIYSSSNTDYLTTGAGTVTGVNVVVDPQAEDKYTPANVTVTATSSTSQGTYSITSSWTVVRKVTDIAMSESVTTKAGKLFKVTASLHPNDDSEENVTTTRQINWSILNESEEEDNSIVEIFEPENKSSTLTYTDSDKSLTATCSLIPKAPGTAIVRAEADGVTSDLTVTVERPGKDDPQIVIRGNASGLTEGSKYTVDIFLKNNPGIVGLNLKLKYDLNYLRLSKVEDTEEDGKKIFANSYHCNVQLQDPYPLSWSSNISVENIEFSGKLSTVIFSLYQTVDENKNLPVFVFYDEEDLDIYNVDLSPVEFAITNSTIKVTDIVYGDVTSDGVVDNLDVMKLSRYLAEWGGEGNIIHTEPQQGKPYTEMEAAELTSDNVINHRDQAVLARYVDSNTIYTTTTEETVRADTEITLPDDAIDKISGTGGEADTMPLVSITTLTEQYIKVASRPNGWAKNYKSYYTYNSETKSYEAVSGDTAPDASGDWPANKYYEKKEVKKTLKAKTATGETATKYDYEVISDPDHPSEDGKKIKFHESSDVPVDSDITVTITYRIYSQWKGTEYELIPLDS